MDGARRKSWSRSKNGHEQHRMFECLPLLHRCNGGYYGCSDSIWGLLCEELIVEILCRLPQKVLIQFKCVTKHWYYLISEVCVPRISPLPLSGIFRLVRYMKHLSVTGAYLQMPNDTPLERDLVTNNLWFHLPRPLRIAFTPSPSELLDMCNGLCLYFSPPINLYCIWNFTTHQFVLFPPPPPLGFKHNQQEELNQCLGSGVFSAFAFDPKQSLHFKVVRFDHSCSTINPGVRPLHIFSSETREWVEYTVDIGPPPVDTAPLVDHCVYLNQALYRLSTSLHLLRYDLEKKVNVTVLKLPDSGSWTSENTVDDLGCIGSSLGCRLYYARHCPTRVLIWMLCDCNDASDWVLMHTIRASDLINHELSIECTPRSYKKNFRQYLETCGSLKLSRFVGKFFRQLRPVAFDPTSDAVILWAPEVTLWYHLGNNKLEVICKSNTYRPFADMAPLKVLTYSRCLVPLKDLGWNHYRQDTGHRPFNFHDVPLQ